jgi:hypothetical protein
MSFWKSRTLSDGKNTQLLFKNPDCHEKIQTPSFVVGHGIMAWGFLVMAIGH